MPRCSHPPQHQHKGRCGIELLEDIEHVATSDGVIRNKTRLGYPINYRRQLASRFGMTREALDRSLLRQHNREEREERVN